MPIYVIRAGQVKPVTRIYQRKNQLWKEILLVQEMKAVPGQLDPAPQVVHDRFQQPPTGLRGVTATYSSAEIAWNAATAATQYQVLMKPKKLGAAVFDPTVTMAWTPQLSLVINGLSQDTEYTFTVRAKRPSPDGTEIESVTESDPITLSIGHDAVIKQNPAWPGTNMVTIDAARTDTWSASYNWDAGSRGPDVTQGYATASDSGRNGYGIVLYSTARSQLNTKVAGLNPGLSAAYQAAVLNSVTVDDAKIDSVFRKNGGAGTPVIHVYPCKISFTPATTRPAPFGGTAAGTTFTAPLENAARDELVISKLLTWAREWIKTAPAHNGMLIFNTGNAGNATAGFNGFAILRSARLSASTSPVNDWRLELWIKWQHTFPAVPPTWR